MDEKEENKEIDSSCFFALHKELLKRNISYYFSEFHRGVLIQLNIQELFLLKFQFQPTQI